MKEYRVCFIKYETYYVSAEDEDTAIEEAYTLDEDNPQAWLGNIDELENEEIKEIKNETN